MSLWCILGKKEQLRRKAETAEKIRIEKEAKASLDRLRLLEEQREMIVEELEEAKARVVEIAAPEEDVADLSAIAALPEKPEEELETLAKVADAVLNSDAHLDAEIKENLEETILDNIIEVANEVVSKERVHFISEEADFEDENLSLIESEEEAVKEFLDENDIMQASDPFSEFLKSHMWKNRVTLSFWKVLFNSHKSSGRG